MFYPSYNLQIDSFTFLAIYFITLSLNILMSADLKLKEMHNLAHESRTRAYCPYSKFAVGACILGADGKYYTGCNVERAVGSVCA